MYILDGKVHFPGVVGKYPQTKRFVDQIIGIFLRIAGAYRQQQ